MQFKSLVVLAAMGALSAQAANINVVFYDNRFGAIDDQTGAFTQTGTLPVSASSGIAAMNGVLYFEDLGAELYSVNPVSGGSSVIGPTGLSTAAGAFAGGIQGLFEIDYGSSLFSLNPGTGAAHLVGATGLAANNGAFDTSLSLGNGSLYYTAGGAGQNDDLYQVNIVTGVASYVGNTGVTGVAGSAFVNGRLELYQYGQATNYIYSAATGSASFIRGAVLGAQIIDGGTVLPASGATSSAIPEPATGYMLSGAFALLALLTGKRAFFKKGPPK